MFVQSDYLVWPMHRGENTLAPLFLFLQKIVGDLFPPVGKGDLRLPILKYLHTKRIK